ncbi:MAG: hypothetical protein ABRQ38_26160, partial [Candidatus Eremiobacterota bacterium]
YSLWSDDTVTQEPFYIHNNNINIIFNINMNINLNFFMEEEGNFINYLCSQIFTDEIISEMAKEITDEFIKKNLERNNMMLTLEKYKDIYKFREEDKVEEYISKNMFLINNLEEIALNIRKYFPAEELILEVFEDPEGIEEDRLMLYISTTLNPREAIEKLILFDKEWWIGISEELEIDDKICIDVECI